MGGYILVSVLILITCALLTLVVLVQNSKGGGLASNFAGSNQIMGVRKTADFLEKSTWTLALVLLVLSLFSIFVIPRGVVKDTTNTNSELRKQSEAAGQQKAVDYQAPPAEGQPVPAE